VAKEVQRHWGKYYKAGLWLEDLHFGLVWSTPGLGTTRTATYLAPSWSWASVNFNKIKGDYMDGIYRHKLVGFGTVSLRDQTPLAKIVEIAVENIDGEPFSRVSSGSLIIRGPYLNVCRCNVPITFFDYHVHYNESSVKRMLVGDYDYDFRH
jgi:hypothetical protein